MPWFVYKCKSCGAELEMVQVISPISRLIKCNAMVGGKACGGSVLREGNKNEPAMTISELRDLVRGIVVKRKQR